MFGQSLLFVSFSVIIQFIYNENPSLLFHSGFGFNPEMVYGQYSPIATPLHSMMMEGQLYSPQQFPFSPTFYPQHGQQHAPATLSSAVPVSPPELMTSESSGENLLFGPGSGYLVPFGSLGGGNISGNPATNPLTSPVAYPQVMGILGSYEQNVVQVCFVGYKILCIMKIVLWKQKESHMIFLG